MISSFDGFKHHCHTINMWIYSYSKRPTWLHVLMQNISRFCECFFFFFFTNSVLCDQDLIKLIISEFAPPVLQEGEKCKRNEGLHRHAKQRRQGDNECECCKTGLILIRTQPSPAQTCTCTRTRTAGDTERFLDSRLTCCFRPWLKDKSGKPLKESFSCRLEWRQVFGTIQVERKKENIVHPRCHLPQRSPSPPTVPRPHYVCL